MNSTGQKGGVLSALVAGLSLVLATPAQAQAEILVPDDVAMIQDAIDLALPGDVIVVDTTRYEGLCSPHGGPCATEAISIVGKGITLVGTPDRVRVWSVHVTDVPENELVLLRGLDVDPYRGPGPGYVASIALSLHDCQGHLWIEDCSFRGEHGPAYTSPCEPGCEGRAGAGSDDGGPGVVVEGCDSVTFNRCEMFGGRGGTYDASFIAPGGDGLRADSALVAVYDSHLEGGVPGGNGAFALDGSALHVSGSSLEGMGPSSSVQAVGSGLKQDGASSLTTTRDNSYVSGAGTPGIHILSGSHDDYPAAFRAFWTSSPILADEPISLGAELGPEDRAFLLVSRSSGHVARPDMQGIDLLGERMRVFDLRDGDPGKLLRAPAALDLYPVNVYFQLVVLTPKGALLGPASAMTLLQGAGLGRRPANRGERSANEPQVR